MKEINGYRLEAIARRETPGSDHYWPAVRLTEVNGRFKATHTLGGLAFNSRDPDSALQAAERGVALITAVRVHRA